MTSPPRVALGQGVKLRLFSDAAGFCQNPACLRALFPEEANHSHMAEIVHIVAASDRRPRADANVGTEYRGSYNNLLVLCPACHTMVDKAPQMYPCGQLKQWKRGHAAKVMKAFGLDCYGNREDARRAIEPLMKENFFIFEKYGPNNERRLDPESEIARVWKRKVLSKILPNNRKILMILDENRALLSAQECTVLEEFRQHVEEIEERHLGDASTVGFQRFPLRMQAILTGA